MCSLWGPWSTGLLTVGALILAAPFPVLAQFNNGIGGAATTVQLPTFGVAIDAEGVLDVKTFSDPGGKLRLERMAAVKADMPADLRKFTKLRKVSLRKLEAAIAERLKAGKPLEAELRYLAGLQRVQFAFCYEASGDEPGDIVLAGPAEGWFADPSGRIVGVTTQRPVILLEDLAVALRAFDPGKKDRPFLGCTIDPTQDGLARFMEFQKTVPRSIPEAAREEAQQRLTSGSQEALGMAQIRTFAVSPRTHFAQVLIEADYRMKRIAIGLEPPPVKMVTFLSALDSPREATLQRWWFTPDYDCVRTSEDRLAMELVGEGVKLQTEDIRLSPDGKMTTVAEKPGKASRLYCESFTKKYAEIAAASPVYAQLRCMIDLSIAAAFLRKHDFYAKAGFRGEIFRDEKSIPCETLPAPKQVPSGVNAVWKGPRLLVPVGGGVSIVPDDALDEKHLQADKNGGVNAMRGDVGGEKEGKRWWWD
jgi:hypothetical protein